MIDDLLQGMIVAIGTIDLPIYMIDSLSSDDRVIVSYAPISSQTNDFVSNDTVYIDIFLDKLSYQGKSVHNIQLIEDTCSTIINHVMNYEALNKLYNITYLGKPIIRTQTETDKSEALIRLQVTTKTDF